MESFPRFDRTELDAREKIESLKAPLVDLFTQLREKIREGGFDAIVSDDTGARIPTLIFREVYKALTDEHPPALFIASGKSYFPKKEEEKELLTEYIQTGLGDAKRVVLVTQYIHEGGTVSRLVEQLHEAGYPEVTTVALDAMFRYNVLPPGDELYVAKMYSTAQHAMAERHPFLSAVAKSDREYSPQPIRLDTAITKGELKKSALVHIEEYDDFWKQVPEAAGLPRRAAFDVIAPMIDDLDTQPLSDDERAAIQKTINFTRQLVQEVAREVVHELRETEVY